MKRISVVALLVIFIMVPALSAADQGQRDVFQIGEPSSMNDNNEIVVPILISHDEDLVAMDIPLEYSTGVTLTDVSFEETRVNYFDAKLSNISADENRVTMGLISMVQEHKPALAAKTSVSNDDAIAYLTFRVDDLSLTEFEIKPFTSDAPSHELSLIYNDYSTGTPVVQTISPEFQGGTIQISAAAKAIPESFGVAQNYPNPFNPSTEISYDLPESGNVSFEIYNILGQNVKTLVNGYQDAGSYTVTWNGDDESGGTVASGVYFYRITSGTYKDIKKMVLMK
jgi:flagellar hook capping protein FlgD